MITTILVLFIIGYLLNRFGEDRTHEDSGGCLGVFGALLSALGFILLFSLSVKELGLIT